MPNTSPPGAARSGMDEVVSIAKTQEAVAELLGVTKQAVQQWVARGYAPPGRVVELEAQYGVPRARLLHPQLASLVDLDLANTPDTED